VKFLKEIIEVRWHGRGGQGAKTAALLLADAALSGGRYVQAFPEYGPERMGAPVQSFNRISKKPINIHCGVENPDVVVVLDMTLLEVVDITRGLSDDGIIIVNSPNSPQKVKEKLKLKKAKVFTVDASSISKDALGREIPNTPLLGALIKATGIIDFEDTIKHVREKLGKKFKSRPEVVEGNIKAIERAYQEVEGE
jgi:pyruvate ferredoxin oxidoreductase gamma subunit